MKKMFLMTLLAFAAVSVSFGDNGSTNQPKYPSITPPTAHPKKENVFMCGLHVYDSDGKLHDCCEEDCSPFLKK